MGFWGKILNICVASCLALFAMSAFGEEGLWELESEHEVQPKAIWTPKEGDLDNLVCYASQGTSSALGPSFGEMGRGGSSISGRWEEPGAEIKVNMGESFIEENGYAGYRFAAQINHLDVVLVIAMVSPQGWVTSTMSIVDKDKADKGELDSLFYINSRSHILSEVMEFGWQDKEGGQWVRVFCQSLPPHSA